MMDEWMDISIDEGVKFFLTSLGKPDSIVTKARENGVKVYHDVHNAELARRAAGAGVDGLNLLNSSMVSYAIVCIYFHQVIMNEDNDLPGWSNWVTGRRRVC